MIFFLIFFRGWGRQKKLLAISTFVLSDKKDLGKLNISTRFLDQFILAPWSITSGCTTRGEKAMDRSRRRKA